MNKERDISNFDFNEVIETSSVLEMAKSEIFSVLRLNDMSLGSSGKNVELVKSNDNDGISMDDGVGETKNIVRILKGFTDIAYFIGAVPFQIKLDASKEAHYLYRNKPQKIFCGINAILILYQGLALVYFQAIEAQLYSEQYSKMKVLTRVSGNVTHLIAHLIILHLIWTKQNLLDDILATITEFFCVRKCNDARKKTYFYNWTLTVVLVTLSVYLWIHGSIIIFVGEPDKLRMSTLSSIWDRLVLHSEICAPFPSSWMNADNAGLINVMVIGLKTIGIVLYVVTIPTKILLIYGAECLPLFICATILRLVHQYNLELDDFRSNIEGKLISSQDHSGKNCTNSEVSYARFENILADYRKLKPLLKKANELLFWIIILGIGCYIPFFAFQMGIVLTNIKEEANTILFFCVRQYLSLALFMGVPSEIHRLGMHVYTFMLLDKVSIYTTTKRIIRINIDREMSILSLKIGNFYVISYELMATVVGLILSYTIVSTQFLMKGTESSCNITATNDIEFP